MPIIKSAIKKVRKDKTRTARNKRRASHVDHLLKEARKKPNTKTLAAFYSAIDKAAKVKLVHKNTAARLKSRLSKLAPSK